ncbi:MAG: hypothetical protein WCT18_04325 [Patescibacteria group bacterium]
MNHRKIIEDFAEKVNEAANRVKKAKELKKEQQLAEKEATEKADMCELGFANLFPSASSYNVIIIDTANCTFDSKESINYLIRVEGAKLKTIKILSTSNLCEKIVAFDVIAITQFLITELQMEKENFLLIQTSDSFRLNQSGIKNVSFVYIDENMKINVYPTKE